MQGWKKKSISPLDIVLDRDNPRINVEPEDKESDIVRKLILHEEVADLARKIVQTGLLPGERIIVVQEQGQWGRPGRQPSHLRLQAPAKFSARAAGIPQDFPKGYQLVRDRPHPTGR